MIDSDSGGKQPGPSIRDRLGGNTRLRQKSQSESSYGTHLEKREKEGECRVLHGALPWDHKKGGKS